MKMRRTKRTLEDRFVLFDSETTCAIAAEKVFAVKRWRWKNEGVPSLDMILRELNRLHFSCVQERADYAESGRLVATGDRKYGHERP